MRNVATGISQRVEATVEALQSEPVKSVPDKVPARARSAPTIAGASQAFTGWYSFNLQVLFDVIEQ